LPDGTTAAGLEIGVRIINSLAGDSPAEFDEVGGALNAGQIATHECVGPCNVITTEGGSAIALGGTEADGHHAPTGPTEIHGNFIGLAADGHTLVGESAIGVDAAPVATTCFEGPGGVT